MERSSLDKFNCFFRAVVVLNNPVGENVNRLILLNYGCFYLIYFSKFSIWVYLCYLGIFFFGWPERSKCRTRVCNVLSCVKRFSKLCQYNFLHPCLRATTWMLATTFCHLILYHSFILWSSCSADLPNLHYFSLFFHYRKTR